MKIAQLILVSLFLSASSLAPLHAGWWPWSKTPLKERLTTAVVAALNTNKQSLFETVHPVGTAQSVKIHDIAFVWKNGKESQKESDLLQVNVRYTIYWDGPLQKDGHTKIEAAFDAESERWSGQVLATSGLTKSDVGYGIGFAIGAAVNAKMQATQEVPQ